jgi:Uma2 family endonuclease
MKSLPQHEMTVDEFLAWAQAQEEGRYELQDGHVIAMAPERVVHTETKGAVWSALRDAIRRAGLPCRALPDGATVRISERTAFEPDALVYCGERAVPTAMEIVNPLIVVEVLSPGTLARDLRDKLSGYFTVPSIQHYLILDTDKRMVIHHARADAGRLLTRLTTEGTLSLDPPGLELPVAALFE